MENTANENTNPSKPMIQKRGLAKIIKISVSYIIPWRSSRLCGNP